MYFRFRGTKFYVDIPAKEYQANPIPIALPEGHVTITSWLGNRPQKVELLQTAAPLTLSSVKCLQVLEGYPITTPVSYGDLVLKIHKEKGARFTCYMCFSRECLAHTDRGFRQELISKILTEPRHEGKVEVESFKVVGIEAPDNLIIHFKVVIRTRF